MSTASFHIYVPLDDNIILPKYYKLRLGFPSTVYSMHEGFVLIELYYNNIPPQPAVYVPLNQCPYTYLQTIYPEFFI